MTAYLGRLVSCFASRQALSHGRWQTPEEGAILDLLATHRMVEAAPSVDGPHWFVTQLGLSKLSYESAIGPGRPILQPRTLPIEDQTSWEHICSLLDSGWVWRPLPNAVKDRLKLPCFDTHAKVGGVTSSRIYLVVLAWVVFPLPVSYRVCLQKTTPVPPPPRPSVKSDNASKIPVRMTTIV